MLSSNANCPTLIIAYKYNAEIQKPVHDYMISKTR